MANSLSFTSTDIKVFPCPNCRETINTTMQQCSFCGTPIDSAAAIVSAEATSQISQACSDASYLRVMAWALITFFLLIFVPFLGLAGVVGLWFLRIAIPVMTIRWWIKYSKIDTTDPDFKKARTSVIIVSVVALLAFSNLFFR